MEVQQIYELVNAATKEAIGKEDLLAEDLSNIVEVGDEIQNLRKIENYTRSLVDHIGKTIFVNRPYSGAVPSILMDGWQYGSILEKIATQLPEATENESWELQDGQSYDPNIFYKPDVIAKFYNSKTTWEIPMSFAERQVRSAFDSATQVNALMSMLTNSIDSSATIKQEELIMRTINNFTADTFFSAFPNGGYGNSVGNARCVNLLKMFNDRYNPGESDTKLAAEDAVTDPDFARFAAYIMRLYVRRMQKMSVNFNIGKQPRFTPADRLHVVMLADFSEAADIFLQSNVYHNEMLKLPEADFVPYWQAQGNSTEAGSAGAYTFDNITGINVKTKNTGGNFVEPTGILAVMFDHEALGVCNIDRRVTTNYNPKAEFFSNWYKFEAQYFNDHNEQFVVFYVADETT